MRVFSGKCILTSVSCALLLVTAACLCSSAVSADAVQQEPDYISADTWISPSVSCDSDILYMTADSNSQLAAYAYPPALDSNTLYTLTLIHSGTAGKAGEYVLIDIFSENAWDTPEHDWHLRLSGTPQSWNTNVFLFNSLSFPTSSLLRVIAPGYSILRFKKFAFAPYDGSIPSSQSVRFPGKADWDTTTRCRVTPDLIQLEPTNTIVFLSRQHLRINPSNYYRLSVTARSSVPLTIRDSVFLDLFLGNIYDNSESEIQLTRKNVSNAWATVSSVFSAANIPRSVTLRVFGTVYSPVELKDIILSPVQPDALYVAKAASIVSPVSYHTNENFWISPLAEVTSNTLILHANTSDTIIEFAPAPAFRSNTLYTMTLVHTYAATGTPAAILIDFFKQDAWDNPEHNWYLRYPGTRKGWFTNVFLFNSLTIPESTSLRIIAPGYSSLRFRDFSIAPYNGTHSLATTVYFTANADWDIRHTCLVTPDFIRLSPKSNTTFLQRNHLCIDPSNSYQLSITVRNDGTVRQNDLLHLDLFEADAYDSPDSEIRISGINLSPDWQTFSKTFSGAKIPRSVTLRLFGTTSSPVDVKDIFLAPVSSATPLTLQIERAPVKGLFTRKILYAFLPALVIVILLVFLRSNRNRLHTGLVYAGLIALSIVCFIIGCGADNSLLSIEIIYQCTVIAILLEVSGWWLARLVLPESYKGFTCLCALPLGFALLTFGTTITSDFLALPEPYATGLILVVSICADILIFTTIARRRFGLGRESIIPISACALGFMCLLGPMRPRAAEGLYSDCIDGLINCTAAEYVKQISDRYSFDTSTKWSEQNNCVLEADRILLKPGIKSVFLARHGITLLPWTRYRLSLTVRSSEPYPGNELTADIFYDKSSYTPESKLEILHTPLTPYWRTYSHEFKIGFNPPLVSLRLLGNLFTTVDVQRVTLESLDRPGFRSREAVHTTHDPRYPGEKEWYTGSTSYGSYLLEVLKRRGTAYSLAAVSFLMKTEAHTVYRVWQTILHLCIALLVYIIVRTVFDGGRAAAGLAAVFTAAAPLLSYTVQNNSLAQTQGMLLLLAFCMITVWGIRSLRHRKMHAVICLAADILLLYALHLTYSKMLVYASALAAAGCLCALLQALYNRSARAGIIVLAGGTVFAIAAAVYIFRMTPAQLMLLKQQYYGDIRVMLSPWLLGGTFDYITAVLGYSVGARLPVLPPLVAYICATGLFLVAVIGLVQASRRTGWFVAGCIAFLILMYFLARYKIKNPYLVKKHLAICIPFLGILLGIGFDTLLSARKRFIGTAVILLLALCIAAGMRSVWVTGMYWSGENWYFDDVRYIMRVLAPRMKESDTVFIKTAGANEQYLYLMRYWKNIVVDQKDLPDARFAIIDDSRIRRYHRHWVYDPEKYTLIDERNGVKILEQKKQTP